MDFVLAFPEQLGIHMKSLRKAAGLSQAGLAELLGVTQSRVAAIEKDPSAISVGQFLAILKLLNAELVVRLKTDGRILSPKVWNQLQKHRDEGIGQKLGMTTVAEPKQEEAKPAASVMPLGANLMDEKGNIVPRPISGSVAVPKPRGMTGVLPPQLLEQLKKHGLMDEKGNMEPRTAHAKSNTPVLTPQILPGDWFKKNPKGSW